LSWGIDAKIAILVPKIMRANPLWAANQDCSLCAAVMPLCIETIATGAFSLKRYANLRLNLSSSCGVKLISGTITNICDPGSRSSTDATHRK
jgi:hypothetical protein